MTLQTQYNLLTEGKGSKQSFVKSAQLLYPNAFRKGAGFNEVVGYLKSKAIVETVGGFHNLQPINQIKSEPEDFLKAFNKYLAEDAKAEEKNVTKEVTDIQDKQYRASKGDIQTLDSAIPHEVTRGFYFEAKQNPDKTLGEIRGVVAKNLLKDSTYYSKNHMFGMEDLPMTQLESEEVSGNHSGSGYGTKTKVLKESLRGSRRGYSSLYESHLSNDTLIQCIEDSNIDPNDVEAVWDTLEYKYPELRNIEDHEWDAYNNAINDHFNSLSEATYEVDKDDVDDIADDVDEDDVVKIKETKTKKTKPPTIESLFKEIDAQGEVKILETKISKLEEFIEAKRSRLNLIDEDNDISELMDKTKIKALNKEIKIYEKQKSKLEKLYEKKCGNSYESKTLLDEDNDDEYGE